MARRSIRRRRRFRAGKREYIWTTALGLRVPLTGGAITTLDSVANLVAGSDWNRGSAVAGFQRQKGAVLQRIVGDVWFQVDTSGGVASLRQRTAADLVFGFLKRDQDDATAVDIAVDAYEEDWLQLYDDQLDTIFDPTPTLTFWGGSLNCHRHIDVRVKRKLTTDDVILFMAQAIAGSGLQNAVTCSFQLRSLVALP